MRNMISAFSPINSPEPMAVSQRTPWHSPVPYLFGGLAAMLGLIAFALLILACSYWKLSVQSDEREGQERDLESGQSAQNEDEKIKEQQTKKVYEEKILVIMAGDQNPTFLATPVTTPKSSSISQLQSNVSNGKIHSCVENGMDGNSQKNKEMGHPQIEQDEHKEEEEEAD
ncbi:protein GLUTAMINE DUMPER 2-like [Benincasa hispida]|uniref:protein GLUTAMINE DUMPER 2-like n=1 Tax=Benincasa hispida TaxID=102211 RepID=UPI0018FFB009|nr:protein GLUTAMINE DUMPER 2-like [Benincasa hispida]